LSHVIAVTEPIVVSTAQDEPLHVTVEVPAPMLNAQLEPLSHRMSAGAADASTSMSQLDAEQLTSRSGLGPTRPLHVALLLHESDANTSPLNTTRHVEPVQFTSGPE
jgi:hypothetical protein